jgi:hypothetical protein
LESAPLGCKDNNPGFQSEIFDIKGKIMPTYRS